MNGSKVFDSFYKKLIDLLGHDDIDDYKDVSLSSIGVDSFVSIELKEWCERLEEKYKNIFKSVNFLDSSCTISYIKNLLKEDLQQSSELTSSFIELTTYDEPEKLQCSRGLTASFIDLATYDEEEKDIDENLNNQNNEIKHIERPITITNNISNKDLQITLNMKWKTGNISVNITDLQTNIYKSNNNYTIDINA